jgi:hypothetical protein
MLGTLRMQARSVGRCPSLVGFLVNSGHVDFSGVQWREQFPALTSLEDYWDLSDEAAMAALAALPGLRRLLMPNDAGTARFLDALAVEGHPGLEYLNIYEPVSASVAAQRWLFIVVLLACLLAMLSPCAARACLSVRTRLLAPAVVQFA